MLHRRASPYRRAILLISETRDHGSKAKLDEVARELGVSDSDLYGGVSAADGRDHRGFSEPEEACLRTRVSIPPNSAETIAEIRPFEGGRQRAGHTEHALLNCPADHGDRERPAEGRPAEIASLSGGEHFTFSSQKSFDAGLLKISESDSLITICSAPKSAARNGFCARSARAAEGHPDAVIQTRRSYWSEFRAPSRPNPRGPWPNVRPAAVAARDIVSRIPALEC